MSTFVFSPSVEAHIESVDGKIVDVSADISSGSVTRVTNGISSANLMLRNAGRKYDGVFDPMGRVVIYMRRVRRLLVFSGYLDMVPAMSAYPGPVRLTASCTLKRLQNWSWDPATDAAYRLLYLGDVSNRADLTDGGLAKRIVRLLAEVAGWPQAQVHIGAIPNDWFTVVAGVARDLIGEATKIQLISLVGSSAYVAGSTGMDRGTQYVQGIGAGTGALPDVAGRLTTYSDRSAHLDARSVRPSGSWYLTMRWPYLTQRSPSSDVLATIPGVDSAKGRQWWAGRRVLVVNPRNNKAVCVAAAGWGPADIYLGPNFDSYDASAAARVGTTSAAVLKALAARDGEDFHFAFAPTGMALGPQDTTQGALVSSGGSTGGTSLAAQLGKAVGGKVSAVTFADTAAAWCRKRHPYLWGGKAAGSNPDPSALDCSGLVSWAHAHTGAGNYADGSIGQYASSRPVSVAEARRTKGALVFVGSSPGTIHHVGVSLGDGTTAEAQSTATGCNIFRFDAQTWNYAGVVPDLDYSASGGSGAGGLPAAGGAGLTGPSFGEALFNVWQWIGHTDFGGDLLGGVRALMNDKPLMQTVDALATAGLRSYCSAPNGDFVAWFPDYFGWWGTAAKMVVADVEIEEGFAVAKSDASLKTHWFVTSSTTGVEELGDATQIYQQYSTAGIASVEFPALMKALFKEAGSFADGGKAFLRRFGARPVWEPMDTISGARQEFFFAVFRFMLNWASQYTAPVKVTFMPELYPGMLMVLPTYGIQGYVTEVTHSFDLAPDAGFSTDVSCIAWSTLGDKGVRGLPRGATL